jgi:hypothetical protein
MKRAVGILVALAAILAVLWLIRLRRQTLRNRRRLKVCTQNHAWHNTNQMLLGGEIQ